MSTQMLDISPVHIFETINAYQRTAALKGAIDLELFTAIGEGNQTASALADTCKAQERGVRILCDYLVIVGFLTKKGNEYNLTPESAMFLDKRSPAYMGGITQFMLSPMLTEGFKDIAAAVRKGGTVIPDDGAISPENPIWVDFAHAMMPMMFMPAQLLAKLVGDNVPLPPDRKLKVLDIAAGHGVFGIALAQSNPNVEVTALDWGSVLEVAEENAQRMGVADRYRLLKGSAFDVEYGSNYDIILLTNFLHHFDPDTCENLLRKVYAALAEKGCAVTVEFVPNEDRVTPPATAVFSLMMLGLTPKGDAYTFSELQRMFTNAGFARNEIHELPPTPNQLVISYNY